MQGDRDEQSRRGSLKNSNGDVRVLEKEDRLQAPQRQVPRLHVQDREQGLAGVQVHSNEADGEELGRLQLPQNQCI